jgi:hypothetical protein
MTQNIIFVILFGMYNLQVFLSALRFEKQWHTNWNIKAMAAVTESRHQPFCSAKGVLSSRNIPPPRTVDFRNYVAVELSGLQYTWNDVTWYASKNWTT